MTAPFKLIVFLFFFPFGVLAAQEEPTAFLRLVNLVTAGEGQTEFFINGESIYQKGYAPGAATAAMGIATGTYTLTAKRAGCEKAEIGLSLSDGPIQTIVAYSVPKRDKDGKILKWNIQFETLSERETKHSYEVACVSFLDVPEFSIGMQTGIGPINEFILTPKKAKPFDAKSTQTYVTVSIKRKKFHRVAIGDPGSYVVLIYKTPDGKLKAMNYYDAKS